MDKLYQKYYDARAIYIYHDAGSVTLKIENYKTGETIEKEYKTPAAAYAQATRYFNKLARVI